MQHLQSRCMLQSYVGHGGEASLRTCWTACMRPARTLTAVTVMRRSCWCARSSEVSMVTAHCTQHSHQALHQALSSCGPGQDLRVCMHLHAYARLVQGKNGAHARTDSLDCRASCTLSSASAQALPSRARAVLQSCATLCRSIPTISAFICTAHKRFRQGTVHPELEQDGCRKAAGKLCAPGYAVRAGESQPHCSCGAKVEEDGRCVSSPRYRSPRGRK